MINSIYPFSCIKSLSAGTFHVNSVGFWFSLERIALQIYWRFVSQLKMDQLKVTYLQVTSFSE